jgi:hypothetical protein
VSITEKLNQIRSSTAIASLFQPIASVIGTDGHRDRTVQLRQLDGKESRETLTSLTKAYYYRRQKTQKATAAVSAGRAEEIATLGKQQEAWAVARQFVGRKALEERWKSLVSARSSHMKEIELEHYTMTKVKGKREMVSPPDMYIRTVTKEVFRTRTQEIMHRILKSACAEGYLLSSAEALLEASLSSSNAQCLQMAQTRWKKDLCAWLDNPSSAWKYNDIDGRITRNSRLTRTFNNKTDECVLACRSGVVNESSHDTFVTEFTEKLLEELRLLFWTSPIPGRHQNSEKTEATWMETLYAKAPASIRNQIQQRTTGKRMEPDSSRDMDEVYTPPMKRPKVPFNERQMAQGMRHRKE